MGRRDPDSFGLQFYESYKFYKAVCKKENNFKAHFLTADTLTLLVAMSYFGSLIGTFFYKKISPEVTI